jgi:hypothetical protein
MPWGVELALAWGGVFRGVLAKDLGVRSLNRGENGYFNLVWHHRVYIPGSVI